MPTRNVVWGLLGLYQADVSINANEIKHLLGNPVVLIPHPGAGKANLILNVIAMSVFGTVPFVNPGGAAATMNYDGASKIAATANLTDLYNMIVRPQTSAGNVIAMGTGSIGNLTDVEPILEVADRSIVIGNFSLTSPQDFTNGDGSLQIALLYTVVKLF